MTSPAAPQQTEPERDEQGHAPPPVAVLDGPVVPLPGTGVLQRQPIVLARVRLACPPSLDLAAVDVALKDLLDGAIAPSTAPSVRDDWLADAILRLAVAAQSIARHPVFDRGAVLSRPDRPGQPHVLAVPYDDATGGVRSVRAAVRIVDLLATAPDQADARAAAREEMEKLLATLRVHGPYTMNTLHLLEAANGMGMPWLRLAGQVYQIGHGAKCQRFESTATDESRAMGGILTRNKSTAAQMLHTAGLPAPTHETASSEDAALRIARHMGYPVVVKPIDLDGGRGVAAGLNDPAAVRRAYQVAAAFGRKVLVEKHVTGEDFRLLVVGGRVAIVITRQPGGVVGDGVGTIDELLAKLNADPRRGTHPGAVLKRIDWDEEAAALLAEQGLAPDAVPASGRFVRLRRAANIATGGIPVDVSSRVHPDNIRMALRAAEVFGMDIAGIDYITPDISLPWHAVDGIINEVNFKPNLGTVTAKHVFGEIVRWMVKEGDGRIPIAAVTGGSDDLRHDVLWLVHRILLGGGCTAGMAGARGAWIGAERVGWADLSGHPGGRVLLTDRHVETALLDLPGPRLAAMGIPFDAADIVAQLHRGPGAIVEIDLLRRARRGIVLPADTERQRFKAQQVTLVSVEGMTARIEGHRALGGRAVWRESGTGGAFLCIADGNGALARLAVGHPPTPAALYAAAIARGLGCDTETIGRTIATDGASGSAR